MSAIVQLGEVQATLEDDRWRSSDKTIADALNAMTDTSSLTGYYPTKADRSKAILEQLQEEFGNFMTIVQKPELTKRDQSYPPEKVIY
jgi:hypothetical protein